MENYFRPYGCISRFRSFVLVLQMSLWAATFRRCTFPPGKVRPEPLPYFPILPFTLPIPVQRSQPDLAENPAVGPQKPLLMSLKSVLIARLL